MIRSAFAILVMMALLCSGCTVPGANETIPAQPGASSGNTTGLQTVTTSATISPSHATTPTNNATNGTGGGTVNISPPAGGVFLIAQPNARYYTGDVITLHGTTILAAGDPLLVEVTSASFGPSSKNSNQYFTGVSGVVQVVQGPTGGPNTWLFSFPTDGFNPDRYLVTVSGLTVKVEDSTTFELLPRVT